TRGRRGRAVALRALTSYAAASAISNGVVKQLVDRSRPAPIGRRGPTKSTSSFPSSHAATASAFSVLVLLEWPSVGWPLLGLATVVAGARVYARQHPIADVVAGIALGVAVSVAVQRLAAAGQRRFEVDAAVECS